MPATEPRESIDAWTESIDAWRESIDAWKKIVVIDGCYRFINLI